MRHTGLTIATVLALVGAGALLLWPRVDAQGSSVVEIAPEVRFAEVAQAAIRSRLRAGAEPYFGPSRVYRFGPADERAVCGSVKWDAGAESPFIVRVLLPRGDAAQPVSAGHRYPTVMEQGPGLVHADARAAARYCRDPEATPATAPAAPEVPQELPVAPAAEPKPDVVTIRSPARLRAAPGGAVLRVAAQGETLEVFGRAPGGWLQVGSREPQGWVHNSLAGEGR